MKKTNNLALDQSYNFFFDIIWSKVPVARYSCFSKTNLKIKKKSNFNFFKQLFWSVLGSLVTILKLITIVKLVKLVTLVSLDKQDKSPPKTQD